MSINRGLLYTTAVVVLSRASVFDSKLKIYFASYKMCRYRFRYRQKRSEKPQVAYD